MQPAPWLQRTTPLPRLSDSPTPLKLLFGRDVRSQIDAVTPELGCSDFLQHGGLHNFVRGALLKTARDPATSTLPSQRVYTTRFGRNQGKMGDLVMVQEADLTLWHEGVHRKLVHGKLTGPWRVSTIITPGSCYHVVLKA